MKQLEQIPFVGPKAMRALQPLVEGNGNVSDDEAGYGSGSAPDDLEAVTDLSRIFGVGPATAWAWVDRGIRSVDEAREAAAAGRLHPLPSVVKVALEHQDELEQGLSRAEVETLWAYAEQRAKRAVARRFGAADAEGLRVTPVGGYLRGKSKSGDLDMLFTATGSRGKAVANALIPLLLEELRQDDPECIIWSQPMLGGNDPHKVAYGGSRAINRGLDSLEKDLTIMRIPGSRRAARVDFIVAYPEQFAFAFLGWTGNKLFNRELRRYADEIGLRLSSRALVDTRTTPHPRAIWSDEAGAAKAVALLYRISH